MRLNKLRDDGPVGPAGLVIDARAGTTYREVVRLMETILSNGFQEVAFLPARR